VQWCSKAAVKKRASVVPALDVVVAAQQCGFAAVKDKAPAAPQDDEIAQQL
jgi:hypothetical protein